MKLIVLLHLLGMAIIVWRIHTSPKSIIIEPIKTHFYEGNKSLIDKAVNEVGKYCTPSNQIKLRLKFDYIPQELLNLNAEQVGMTSFFSDVTFIETNIYKFAYLSESEKYVYLLHEIGHAIGLEHSDDPMSVMNKETNGFANIENFYSQVKKHCNYLIDVPREPNFSSQSEPDSAWDYDIESI